MKVAEENGIMRGPVICILTKYYFRMDKLRRIRLSRHVVCLSEIRQENLMESSKHRWEDSVEMELKGSNNNVWTEFICLRIGTNIAIKL
jgi:hypothetical protein